MVYINIGAVWTTIDGLPKRHTVDQLIDIHLELNIADKIHNELRYHPQGFYFQPRYHKKKFMNGVEVRTWDGYNDLLYNNKFKNNSYLIYSGLVPRMLKVLQKNNVEYNINRQYQNNINVLDEKLIGVELRDYQKEAVEIAKKKKRCILSMATGGGKCFAKGTKILMYDGSIKKVEDIIVGDQVMGDDSTARDVINLSQGNEELFKIIPNKGEPWICNKSHVLSLQVIKGCPPHKYKYNSKIINPLDIINISIEEYLKTNNTFKHITKLYRKEVKFKYKKISKYLPPYFLGLWLGDGHSNNTSICTMDKPIYMFVKKFANKIGANIRKKINHNSRALDYFITWGIIKKGMTIKRYSKQNKVLNAMRKYNLINNKHIPHEYKCNTRQIRLKVLAGLIDSDGYYDKKGCYGIVTKFDQLKDDILYLCRSLGFAAYANKVIKGIKSTGFKGEYWRITISGHTNEVPVLLPRKKARVRRMNKDVLVTGFKVEEMEEGKYYGFEVNKNNLFLLGNFTVAHNSLIISKLAKDIQGKVLIVVNRVTLFRQLIDSLTKQLGLSQDEINYFGDIKQYNPNNRITVATFQSLVTKEKILVEGKKKKTYREELILKHQDIISQQDVIVIDEAHHTSSNELGIMLTACKKAIYRIGLSATAYREDGADLMLEAHIGPIAYNLTSSNLIKQGYLSKPKIYMLKMKYNVDPNLSYGKQHTMLGRFEYKNKTLAQIAYKLACNGRTVLMSFSRIENLELIREELDKINVNGLVVKNIIGENSAEEKIEAVQKLNMKEYNIVLSTLFGEGIDVKNLNALILVRNTKSKTDAVQQVGRVLRIGEDDTEKIVIDTLDSYEDNLKLISQGEGLDDFDGGDSIFELKSTVSDKKPDFFQQHALARLATYRAEPEFVVKIIDSVEEIEEII